MVDHVTVSADAPIASYTVVGSQSEFTFSFTVFAKSDLHVKVGSAELSQSDFTFAGSTAKTGGYQGGTITLNTAATDTTVLIWSNIPPSRLDDLTDGQPLDIGALNTVIDQCVARERDHAWRLGRSLHVPVGEDPIGDLPALSSRASKLLGFNASGDPIASEGATSGVTVSPFMATVLDDADAGAALSTLGVSAFAKTILDDTDAAAARRTLAVTDFVDDITDLLSYSTSALNDGFTLRVNGFHPSSIDGGGMFVWSSSTAKTSHNGGTIISPTCTWDGTEADLPDFLDKTNEGGSGNGCWLRLISGPYQPEWWGGGLNSLTTDSNAVQAAIDAAGDFGSVRSVPGNTYSLDGVSILYSNMNIEILGRVNVALGDTAFTLGDGTTRANRNRLFANQFYGPSTRPTSACTGVLIRDGSQNEIRFQHITRLYKGISLEPGSDGLAGDNKIVGQLMEFCWHGIFGAGGTSKTDNHTEHTYVDVSFIANCAYGIYKNNSGADAGSQKYWTVIGSFDGFPSTNTDWVADIYDNYVDAADNNLSGCTYILAFSTASGLTGAAFASDAQNCFVMAPTRDKFSLGGGFSVDTEKGQVEITNLNGGNAVIDIKTDPAVDYGLRFIRSYDASNNGDTRIRHKGTGDFILQPDDAGGTVQLRDTSDVIGVKVDDADANNTVYLRVNGNIRKVQVGAADSGGTGFRQLIVAN